MFGNPVAEPVQQVRGCLQGCCDQISGPLSERLQGFQQSIDRLEKRGKVMCCRSFCRGSGNLPDCFQNDIEQIKQILYDLRPDSTGVPCPFRRSAICPTVRRTFCRISSSRVTVFVSVPFVHTSIRLAPTLSASVFRLENAYSAASMVFFPSSSHACLNGSNIFPNKSRIFCASSAKHTVQQQNTGYAKRRGGYSSAGSSTGSSGRIRR